MRLGIQNFAVVWPLMLALLVTACAEDVASVDDPPLSMDDYSGDTRRISSAALAAAARDPAPVHQTFAFDDFRAQAGDDNLLTAPFDIQQLLASLALGATDKTLQAIATAGGWPSLDDSARTEIMAGISLWEQRIDGLASVERQRWLWGQAGYRFRRDYLQTQAELFGPEMTGVDFRADSEGAIGRIQRELGDSFMRAGMGDRSRLVLAQRSQLQVAWPEGLTVERFEGRFGEQEDQRWVPMLRMQGELSVAEGENYQAVAVPLAEGGLSLLLIIPAPGAFDEVRAGLNHVFWRQLTERLAPQQTTLNLPLFSLRGGGFEYLDLGIAQSEEQANFSPVNGAGFLYLEPLRHSIELQAGEAGLSATTVSMAVHTATEDEPAYLFDSSYSYFVSGYGDLLNLTVSGSSPCFYPPDQRPFLFALYARDTATLLHLGQVKALDGASVEADWSVSWWEECGNSPLMLIYRYKGSLQCEYYNSGLSSSSMARVLKDAGIDVDDYEERTDGKQYPQVCGGPDGVINVFTIHEDQLATAVDLGFKPLSELTGN